jgi:hypothetical protein
MTQSATVTGRVTGGAHGWAFGRTLLELDRYGYVEEEYLFEGVATRYGLAPGTVAGRDGKWVVEPTGECAYRTRFIVMRPADAAAFNGIVVLSWNNVSAGFDSCTGVDSVQIVDDDFAFVAVTTQRVGVHGFPEQPAGLAAWDAERYGSLSISSDDYSFDIFTQAARAIGPQRARGGVDPMGGLDVRYVIAQGSSQSAARLATYVNAVQPLEHAVDAFLLGVYFGSGSQLDVGEAVMNPAAGMPPRRFDPHLLRDDLEVPVMVVNSELEATPGYAVRQPDTDRYRLWETAGTSHVYYQAMVDIAPRFERDFGVSVPVARGMNEVPAAPVNDAAMHHMQRWLGGGPPPPAQPRIEFAGDPPEIVRDEHGIARGGIRLPQVEVPIATNASIPPGDEFTQRLGGSCVPFSDEKLRALYGDAATYLARFEEATRAAEKAGVILPRDVDTLIEDARAQCPLTE